MLNERKLIVYTDGGARGNPGPAGVGVVITTPELDKKRKHLELLKKYIGEATNNVAEYQALILGFERAKAFKAEQVEVRMDSELVVKQMKREYKVKDKDLGKLFVKAWNLTHSFKKISFTYIPRERNTVADMLVNEAIDEINPGTFLRGIKPRKKILETIHPRSRAAGYSGRCWIKR